MEVKNLFEPAVYTEITERVTGFHQKVNVNGEK